MNCPKCNKEMQVEPKSGNYLCIECGNSIRGYSEKISLKNRLAGFGVLVVCAIVAIAFFHLEFIENKSIEIGDFKIPFGFGIIAILASISALMGLAGLCGLLDMEKFFGKKTDDT